LQQEIQGHGVCFLTTVDTCAHCFSPGKTDPALNLFGKQSVYGVKIGGEMIAQRTGRNMRIAKITGKKHGPQTAHDFTQGFQGGHGYIGQGLMHHNLVRCRGTQVIHNAVNGWDAFA
jgi:hypothetical protein